MTATRQAIELDGCSHGGACHETCPVRVRRLDRIGAEAPYEPMLAYVDRKSAKDLGSRPCRLTGRPRECPGGGEEGSGETTMLADRDKVIPGGDVWVPTVCAGCYNCCGILVHRVDGRVVEIKGDPDAANSKGYICAKGLVRAIDVHHPSRVTKPLKRTNPEKGIGVDPGWQEISWDEAMEISVAALKKVRAKDPRGLILSHFDIAGLPAQRRVRPGVRHGQHALEPRRLLRVGVAPGVAHHQRHAELRGRLPPLQVRRAVGHAARPHGEHDSR